MVVLAGHLLTRRAFGSLSGDSPTARLEPCAVTKPAPIMSHAKPLLLLDVDGVLCPIGPGPGDPMCTLVADDWPITFSQQLPSRLSRLSERFTLVWATSWEQAANRALAPVLGLLELPFVSFGGTSARRGRTWKLRAVRRFVNDRPVAWVDDELGLDAHQWAERRAEPTLLIDVNPSWGFADAHVELLIQFADRLLDPDAHRGNR
jgi:hypothetical protein